MGEDVLDEGAVGVRLDGVEVLPCVSQGATPIGPELTITAADGNIIDELAGRPALETLRETIESLPAEELELVQGGLLMGIVVDANKPDYVQGDFLVRGLVGADPATGKVAVAADVHPGQVVRLHARDADQRRPRPARGARDPHGRARRPRAGGRAGVLLQRPRARHVHARPTTTRTRSPRRCSARRPPGSSPRARSARSAASTSSTASRRPSPCSRRLARLMELRGRTALVTGATGGLGTAIARALARARRLADPHRPPGRRAGAARRRDRRPGDRVRPRRPRRRGAPARRGGRRGRARGQRRACPGSGHITSFSAEDIDRAIAVNLRAPMVMARRAGRADGRARLRPPRVRLLAVGQGRQRRRIGLRGDEVRAARLRARAARGPARQRRRRLGRAPGLHPRQRDVPRRRA